MKKRQHYHEANGMIPPRYFGPDRRRRKEEPYQFQFSVRDLIVLLLVVIGVFVSDIVDQFHWGT